jgi:hypothetical protein
MQLQPVRSISSGGCANSTWPTSATTLLRCRPPFNRVRSPAPHTCGKASDSCARALLHVRSTSQKKTQAIAQATTLALVAPHADFCLQLLQHREHSELVHQILRLEAPSTHTLAHAMAFVRADEAGGPYRVEMLEKTMDLLVSSTEALPFAYECASELIRVHGLRLSTKYALQACQTIDAGHGSRDLVRILYELLLVSTSVDPDCVLFKCCTHYRNGHALRVLLEYCQVDDRNAYYANLASQYGAWGSLETCLDLLPWRSEEHAPLLVAHMLSRRSGSRWMTDAACEALGRLLSRLLPHVPNEQLTRSLVSMDDLHFATMHLIECHIHRNVALPASHALPTLQWGELMWLLRRHPAWRNRILTAVTPVLQATLLSLEAEQARLCEAVLANTSLAKVLARLVSSYL